MWLIFALIAPFFWAVVHVLDEYCVDEVLEQPWMGVVTSAAATLVAYAVLPFVILFFDVSHYSWTWICLGISVGVIIQLSQVLYFNALSYSEAGIVAAYWNFIPAILPLASFLLFRDILSISEYTGIIILILSSIVICLLDYHVVTRINTLVYMLFAALMQVVAYLLMTILYENQSFIISFYSVISGIVLVGLCPLLFSYPRKVFRRSMHKIYPNAGFFILIEICNILGLGFAQMAVKLGDASLVSAVETTTPAFTFLLSVLWIKRMKSSQDALHNHIFLKILTILAMTIGVWFVS